MPNGYRIIERPPTAQEYRRTCVAVGWEPVMNFQAAEISLANSLYHVVAIHDEDAVGMGRIIGDGAVYFYIQDIAALPGHQHRGVGTLIMDRLMDHLQAIAPEKAFIGLFAAEGTASFYERYGFDAYPALTGMFRVISAGVLPDVSNDR